MQLILSYLQDYFRNTDKWWLLFCATFAGILVFFNYRFGIETKWIRGMASPVAKFFAFYAVYCTAFIIPCIVLYLTGGHSGQASTTYWVMTLLAPAVFALKVSIPGPLAWFNSIDTASWKRYFAIIANLPFRLLVVVILLMVWWWWQKPTPSFWGLTTVNFKWQPYLLMLLIMVPLIAFASSRPDFLQAYPKARQVSFIDQLTGNTKGWRALFEISYGLDFLTIELFFRGLLVFAFVRFIGPDAVLPMAVFYCSIHFGKPLFECISSFFGGLFLGIIACRTGSILGGIVVHVGIAWLMEAGGYIGNLLKR